MKLPDEVTSPRNPDFRFTTKGETLARLGGRLMRSRLCDQVIVPVRAWREDPETVTADIILRFAPRPLAVRSSSDREDGWDNSNAGAFLSVTNVEPAAKLLAEAIDRVIDSYGEQSDAQQVLIQPMVSNVALSGVVLTRDLDTGGPYYVINYDDYSGRTDTVTGGGISKTVMMHRNNPEALRSPRIRKLIAAVQEIESLTGCDELDIEFCVTSDTEVYVLQVRPLAARQTWRMAPDEAISDAIADIRARLGARMAPSPGLAGATTILGEMPDWNPAEMIGNAPRPLALSLYKRLITDRVWGKARAAMGYRRIDAPLLVDFHGRPFIDVRLSFNSFLPADMEDGLADRLVDHQLATLSSKPELHDKIEFEIAITCRDFSFPGKRAALRDAGFSDAEISSFEKRLGKLTRGILQAGVDGLDTLLAMPARLPRDRSTADISPDLAGALLDECAKLGTLPFAQLARHGFMAVLFLKSLVKRGVFGQEDADRFLRTTDTVANRLVHDMDAVARGAMESDDFLRLYGHLRPGTYDITSWRYDERPDLYFARSPRAREDPVDPFSLSRDQHSGIRSLLREFDYSISPEQLLEYVAAAVRAREQAKFDFTRALSNVLTGLSNWADGIGLSREDLSFLSIDDLLSERDHGRLRERVRRNREFYLVTRALRLPHLLCDSADIDVVRLPLGQPTYITGRSITAPVIRLEANSTPTIDGMIVLIESADPGFDWIFSHGIAGLITKYGGVNSHMSIRAAEFGVPAAIGCGERLFEAWADAEILELNCAAGYVRAH